MWHYSIHGNISLILMMQTLQILLSSKITKTKFAKNLSIRTSELITYQKKVDFKFGCEWLTVKFWRQLSLISGNIAIYQYISIPTGKHHIQFKHDFMQLAKQIVPISGRYDSLTITNRWWGKTTFLLHTSRLRQARPFQVVRSEHRLF